MTRRKIITETHAARPEPIEFTVIGKIQSKESYRGRSKAAKRARGITHDKWRDIKAYQSDIGWSARAALGRTPKRFAGHRVIVTIHLYAPSVDVDNSKAIVDGMVGVVFDDDSPKYVKEVHMIDATFYDEQFKPRDQEYIKVRVEAV